MKVRTASAGASIVASLAIAVSLAAAAACSPFAATADGSDAASANEGGAADGGASGDAGGDAGALGVSSCFDFTDPKVSSAFTSVTDMATTMADTTGARVSYPANLATTAALRREIEVPTGATGATVSLYGDVSTMGNVLPTGRWFATLGSLAHGPMASGQTSSLVLIRFSGFSASQMELDMNTFPAGALGSLGAATRFSSIAADSHFRVFFDVTWSTDPAAAHGHAQLGEAMTPTNIAPGVTWSGQMGNVWTLSVGGGAGPALLQGPNGGPDDANPATTITFTGACVTPH